MALRDRPTADLIVIILTGTVAFVIVVTMLTAVGGVITGHEANVVDLLKAVGDLTQGLIALIVGYLAGRGVNGKPKPPS